MGELGAVMVEQICHLYFYGYGMKTLLDDGWRDTAQQQLFFLVLLEREQISRTPCFRYISRSLPI
jgi:hypothetical protein